MTVRLSRTGRPMPTLTVHLADDLAEFVRQSVADGAYTSADELFAHAVGLVRTESVLGHSPTADPAARPTPHQVPAVVPSAPVDLTRQGFDSPAFMANLVGKLEQKRAEERRLEQPR